MTMHVATTLAKAWRERARRLSQGKAGVAAVEFALILPLMLTLYFGCVVIAQGFEVARKTQFLSRTLADLTSQTLPTGSQTNPTLQDADIANILNASTAVLYPFTDSPNVTITEIVFDNVSSANSKCCVAKVMWSVSSGPSPTLRTCGTLTASVNGVNGATTVPMGVYPGVYPAGGGDALSNPSGFQPSPLAASGNATDYYLIVADVSYNYKPSFGFAPFAWNRTPNGGAGYKITQTTYMTPRNGATSPIQWTPGATFTLSTGAACSANTTCYMVCTSGANAYNTP